MTVSFEQLTQCLGEVASHLFELLGRPARVVAGTPPVEGRSITAMIGFSAEHARGMLVVQAKPEVAAILSPGRNALDEMVGEALGEFSNVLLGRFKNELLPLGPVLSLSLPMVTWGKCVHVGRAVGPTCSWLECQLEGGSFYIMLTGSFDPEFRLGDWKPGQSVQRRQEAYFF